MLSEKVKQELIDSTRRNISLLGLEAIAQAAPHFVDMAILAGRVNPEQFGHLAAEYLTNRKEVEDIINGMLGRMQT